MIFYKNTGKIRACRLGVMCHCNKLILRLDKLQLRVSSCTLETMLLHVYVISLMLNQIIGKFKEIKNRLMFFF